MKLDLQYVYILSRKKKEKEQNKKETEINELSFRGNMC